MSIPFFSWFSAISEIFVTTAVIYGVLCAAGGKPLMKRLLGAVFSFELLVNIVYMAQRAAKADTSSDLSAGMKIFFAVHGTLSLAMFIAGVVLYMLAMLDDREQELELKEANVKDPAAEAVLSELEEERGGSPVKAIADFVAEPRFFERHKVGAYVFVFFWMVSFLTGEAIFYMRFGEQLFG